MFQAAQMYKNNMDYGRVPRALSDEGVQCDGAASRIFRTFRIFRIFRIFRTFRRFRTFRIFRIFRVVEAATKNCRRTRDM